MQYQPKDQRQDQEQKNGEGEERLENFPLPEISESFWISTGGLIAEKAIGDPAIKSVGSQRYDERRKFYFCDQVSVEHAPERAKQKSSQCCHPNVHAHVV